MLTLNDGRNELWQWDTGRTLNVDAECSQVHFSNKVFGRSIDVDVIDGVSIIPDILLQTDKDLNAWAFVGTAESGYTKISKTFKVNRRNKPADYVFTPPEQTTLGEILERLDDIESAQDPDAIKNAVDDYLDNNPIQIEETDPTVPAWAKQPTKPEYTAAEVGAQIADCVVTFSGANEEELTADKTFEEVKAAYNEGRTLVGMYSGKRYDFYSDGGGEGFGFVKRVVSTLDYKMIWLWEGDSVQFRDGVLSVSHPVQSVNGKTGAVSLTAEDVGALPEDTEIPTVPTNVSAFTNDAGYAKTSEIPTDDHINQLINTALGVIENGTY